jgi:hypothetical protein
VVGIRILVVGIAVVGSLVVMLGSRKVRRLVRSVGLGSLGWNIDIYNSMSLYGFLSEKIPHFSLLISANLSNWGGSP